jgi:hypothetical protein
MRRNRSVEKISPDVRMKERPVAERTYYAPHGGLPGQTGLLTDLAVFTEAYAVIPNGVYPQRPLAGRDSDLRSSVGRSI